MSVQTVYQRRGSGKKEKVMWRIVLMSLTLILPFLIVHYDLAHDKPAFLWSLGMEMLGIVVLLCMGMICQNTRKDK